LQRSESKLKKQKMQVEIYKQIDERGILIDMGRVWGWVFVVVCRGTDHGFGGQTTGSGDSPPQKPKKMQQEYKKISHSTISTSPFRYSPSG